MDVAFVKVAQRDELAAYLGVGFDQFLVTSSEPERITLNSTHTQACGDEFGFKSLGKALSELINTLRDGRDSIGILCPHAQCRILQND